mmetsp:Transcript_18035/g.35246  ORF Transcript_18035/g.35246 Transcript_18035/m.35246 type:complete len:380 (+) Transcript_18035:33-1172(+)
MEPPPHFYNIGASAFSSQYPFSRFPDTYSQELKAPVSARARITSSKEKPLRALPHDFSLSSRHYRSAPPADKYHPQPRPPSNPYPSSTVAMQPEPSTSTDMTGVLLEVLRLKDQQACLQRLQQQQDTNITSLHITVQHLEKEVSQLKYQLATVTSERDSLVGQVGSMAKLVEELQEQQKQQQQKQQRLQEEQQQREQEHQQQQQQQLQQQQKEKDQKQQEQQEQQEQRQHKELQLLLQEQMKQLQEQLQEQLQKQQQCLQQQQQEQQKQLQHQLQQLQLQLQQQQLLQQHEQEKRQQQSASHQQRQAEDDTDKGGVPGLPEADKKIVVVQGDAKETKPGELETGEQVSALENKIDEPEQLEQSGQQEKTGEQAHTRPPL